MRLGKRSVNWLLSLAIVAGLIAASWALVYWTTRLLFRDY